MKKIASRICTGCARPRDGMHAKVFHAKESPRSIYTDNLPEFVKACEELIWIRERSTPRGSETHGIRSHFVSSGSVWTSRKLWAKAMECYCYLRYVQDLLAVGSIHHLKGRLFRLEQKVKFYPISSDDQGRVHQFGTEAFLVTFMGYALRKTEYLKTMPPLRGLATLVVVERPSTCQDSHLTGKPGASQGSLLRVAQGVP